MQYELYLDIFFLTNFFMNYIVLHMTRRVFKKSVSRKRMIAGAMIGAFGECILIICPIPSCVRIVVSYFAMQEIMLFISFRPIKMQELLQMCVAQLVIAILVGGFLYFISEQMGIHFRFGILYVSCVFVMNLGFEWIARWYENLWTIQKQCMKVILILDGKRMELKGLIDSGNLLRMKNGEPVHVMGRSVLRQFSEQIKLDRIYYVPYQTITEKEGVLLVIKMEQMILCFEQGEKVLKEPMVGIAEQEKFGNGMYEILLHSKINQ